MISTPWGPLPCADAHVHFFSRDFLAALAMEKGIPLDDLGRHLGWQIPADAHALAEQWAAELDRHGVERAALVASKPGDQDSVIAAVEKFPGRFFAWAMVNPCAAFAADSIRSAFQARLLRGLSFFPAMHRYSIQDERALAMIDMLAERGGVAFVHCGALTVGFRAKLGLRSDFDLRFSNPVDLHRVALLYPQVKFVIPHFGAGYFREALMVADLSPNVYLDTSSSNQWMRYEAEQTDLRTVFRRALAVLGPSRLLFGTDSSFFPRGWIRAVYETQAEIVPEDSAERIFHENFERLFPLR